MKSTALTLLFSVFLLNNVFTKAKDVNIISTSCSPKDLSDQYSDCTLKCAIDLKETSFKADDYKFYYYSTDPDVNIDLSYDDDYVYDVDKSYSDNQVTLDLTLRDGKYYAGFYVCWAKLVDTVNGNQTTVSEEFQIDPNNAGVLLGSKCSTSQECLALGAECTVNCECGSDYVNYNGNADTPACLPKTISTCIIDAQCEIDSYKCENNDCQGTESSDETGLSTGAIVGIAIGCAAFLAITIGLAINDRKRYKRFWKTHRVVAAAVVVVEEVDDNNRK